MTKGNASDIRQLRVSIDLVLLEHNLCCRPNLIVWGGYVMLVLWSCTVFRTGRRLVWTMDIIVHQFAGTLGPEFILMVDKDQLRRARGVRGFIGREYVQRMDWLARSPDLSPI